MTGKEIIDWIKQYKMEDTNLHVEISQEGPSGLYECFHCLHKSVVWQSDFTFEDYMHELRGRDRISCAHWR